MYVGSREGAEDVIGHVVVECYDYDEVIRCCFTYISENAIF